MSNCKFYSETGIVKFVFPQVSFEGMNQNYVTAQSYRADKLATLMCRLSRNSGSLNPIAPRACPGQYNNCFIFQSEIVSDCQVHSLLWNS
jgi:hypothetical protein